MLDLQFKILEKLYAAEHHTMNRIALINDFEGQINEADDIVDILLKYKYLRIFNGTSSVKLTSKGIDEYLSEQQRRDDNAKQAAAKDAEQLAQVVQSEKNKKQERRLNFIISIVSAIVGSLTTLCVEHFQELVNAIFSFFSSFAA